MNIDALSGLDTGGLGKIRMVVSDPARAKEALRGAKYRLTETALSVTLENCPGTLASPAEKLAGAKVNIESIYATTAAEAGLTTVVMTVSNVEKAQSAFG